MNENMNLKTVTLKLTRAEVIDLMKLCTAASNFNNATGKPCVKWDVLHSKIESILYDFDAKHKDKGA